MGRFSVLAVCVCILAGCAAVGAEGTMLSDNTALISATGRSVEDRAEIVDNALKEAANVTSAHGYRYFTIISADNTSTSMTVAVPGQRYFIQMPGNRAAATFGPAAYAGGMYTGPDRTVTRFKPGLDIIIQMYRQGEIDPSQQGVWNADVVLGRFVAAK